MHVPIPLDDVRAALPAWDIADAEFSELERGATAEVWKVECERGTFVAKYAYDDREHFEIGLTAAEVALQAGLHSAAPLRTTDDELTVMLEWPTGHWHPLALLHWVEGAPLDGDAPGAVEEYARIHGSLQAALARELPLQPSADPFGYLDYLDDAPEDLGDGGKLQAIFANVAAEARSFQDSTTMTIATAVWDGPEVMVDDRGQFTGLIDFGGCGPLPVVHAMANRSLCLGLEYNDRARRFVELYVDHFPLSDAELAGVPIFRKVSIAIYTKYHAWRLATTDLGEARGGVEAYVARHLELLA